MLQPIGVQKGHFYPEPNHNPPASPVGFTNSSIFTTFKQKNGVICHQRVLEGASLEFSFQVAQSKDYNL